MGGRGRAAPLSGIFNALPGDGQRFFLIPREGHGQNMRWPCAEPCSSGKRSPGSFADLRQRLVFARLTFKHFDPCLALVWPFTAITLDLAHPNAKAVLRTAQSTRDRRQHRSSGLVLIAVVHRQSHRIFEALSLSRILNAVSPDEYRMAAGSLLQKYLFHNRLFPESFALR